MNRFSNMKSQKKLYAIVTRGQGGQNFPLTPRAIFPLVEISEVQTKQVFQRKMYVNSLGYSKKCFQQRGQEKKHSQQKFKILFFLKKH